MLLYNTLRISCVWQQFTFYPCNWKTMPWWTLMQEVVELFCIGLSLCNQRFHNVMTGQKNMRAHQLFISEVAETKYLYRAKQLLLFLRKKSRLRQAYIITFIWPLQYMGMTKHTRIWHNDRGRKLMFLSPKKLSLFWIWWIFHAFSYFTKVHDLPKPRKWKYHDFSRLWEPWPMKCNCNEMHYKSASPAICVTFDSSLLYCSCLNEQDNKFKTLVDKATTYKGIKCNDDQRTCSYMFLLKSSPCTGTIL